MLRKLILALAAAAALVTPAAATTRDYYGQYHTYWRHWHPYPNYTAYLPYGWPMIAYTRSAAYVPGYPYGPVPVNVYYIRRSTPVYNVPPYTVIAPY
ncbi:hypothetical protein DES32_1857 [Methylovirgula ligni]|uniref:PXPV repeat-containing protein n=1 Tax=Methylovirgula ligni TaxID=569860 RepID=A0A3D9YVS4_9HYPH|nr:hypothetical protein [Methylovirgula ligni]REF85821.1 hypothetical protein DES32_1857 [Methylovirgula ligni]